MKHIHFCLLAVLSCITMKAECNPNLDRDSVLQRVDELKALVDQKYWPTFNAPQYALEMNYYEDGPFRMHLVANGELLDDKLRNIGAGQ